MNIWLLWYYGQYVVIIVNVLSLQVDCEMLADALFELASEDQCFTRNRAAIYNLITK